MAEPEHDATAPAPPRWLHDAEQVAQKYEEAIADAVEECAEDTAGQRCYAKQRSRRRGARKRI